MFIKFLLDFKTCFNVLISLKTTILLFLTCVAILSCGPRVNIDCTNLGVTLWGCVPATPAPTVNPNLFSRVYLWSQTTLTFGDLGGIAGADASCVAASGGASLPTGTYTHQALISSTTQDARNIIDGASGPLRRPDNTLIANTWADFFDQTYTLVNPIQTGVPILYWSGLNNTGAPSTNHCNNWTLALSTGNGAIGGLTQTSQWRLIQTNFGCATGYRVLCVSYGN